MRSFFLFAGLVFFALKTMGQLPPARFTRKIGGKEISIETIVSEQKKEKHNTLLIYFCGDSASPKEIRNAFAKFSDALPSSTVMLKIETGPIRDSNAIVVLHAMANDVVKELLPELKKYKGLSTDNIIVAGVNVGAVLAFYSATASSRKIKRTGMFFVAYEPFLNLKKENDSAAFDIAGKVFVYNKKEKAEDISADEFCEALALNADLLLYKVDVIDDDAEKAWGDFFGWIMTEGSNYEFNAD